MSNAFLRVNLQGGGNFLNIPFKASFFKLLYKAQRKARIGLLFSLYHQVPDRFGWAWPMKR